METVEFRPNLFLEELKKYAGTDSFVPEIQPNVRMKPWPLIFEFQTGIRTDEEYVCQNLLRYKISPSALANGVYLQLNGSVSTFIKYDVGQITSICLAVGCESINNGHSVFRVESGIVTGVRSQFQVGELPNHLLDKLLIASTSGTDIIMIKFSSKLIQRIQLQQAKFDRNKYSPI